MSNKQSKYFFCYDQRLSKYLNSKGFSYITRAKHYATDSEFALYEYHEDMQQHMDEWKNKK